MIDTSPKLRGEPTAQALASGLATLGRYGDSYMVHAAEGETVVPGEILDANPQLKNELFGQMRAMGIEDPNRYVVGNGLNSINPITGQPEFFFKKIFRAIKKVFKKVLPIAAPIIGNIIAPGIGGPIASALTTKLTGGSWKDALKSGALAYGAQSLMSGIGALGTEQNFMGGVQEGLMAPVKAAGNIFASGSEAALNPFQQGIFGNANRGFNMDTFFPKYDPTGGGASYFGGAEAAKSLTPTSQTSPFGLEGPEAGMRGMTIQDPNRYMAGAVQRPSLPVDGRFRTATGSPTPTDWNSGVRQVGGDGPEAFAATGSVAPSSGSGDILGGIGKKVQDFIGTPLGGNLASAATIGGITYLLSPEEDLKDEQLAQLSNPERQAYDQLKNLSAADRQTPAGIALLRQSGIQAFYTPEQLARIIGKDVAYTRQWQRDKFGKEGKKAGGEISGPGTGRSDSIPAMLSDGEFVMTAEAVRNAGNGDRNLGAARMYDMMHSLEGRA